MTRPLPPKTTLQPNLNQPQTQLCFDPAKLVLKNSQKANDVREVEIFVFCIAVLEEASFTTSVASAVLVAGVPVRISKGRPFAGHLGRIASTQVCVPFGDMINHAPSCEATVEACLPLREGPASVAKAAQAETKVRHFD